MPIAALAALVVTVCLGLSFAPAQAAFPGRNGPVYYGDSTDARAVILGVNPSGIGRAEIAPGGTPVVSPDGTRIAFVQEAANGTTALAVMNIDGSGITPLPSGAARDPAWSPDGSRIVFVAADGLVVINADGTGRRVLTDGGDPPVPYVTPGDANYTISYSVIGHPSWSPSGGRIAFTGSLSNSEWDILTIDESGGDAKAVTSGAGFARPDWSPDGTRFAVDRSVNGAATIFVMNADGSDRRALTDPGGPTIDMDPSWSPDGTRIAFLRTAGFDTEVFAMDAGGGYVVNLNARGGLANPRSRSPNWANCPSAGGCLLPSLTGGPAADVLRGTAGQDAIRGGGGGDLLCGRGGSDKLFGDAGNDRLYGDACPRSASSRATAGASNDRLYGGAGNDLLDGGKGVNRYSGGSGNDTIRAANGRQEIVDCGSGRDKAIADRIDRVRGCERVTRRG